MLAVLKLPGSVLLWIAGVPRLVVSTAAFHAVVRTRFPVSAV